MDARMRLAGEIATEMEPDALADALARAGLTSRARWSAHAGRHTEVRVASADADIDLERTGAAEYLARADAAPPAMDALARALSDALAALGIRHRLELYADDHDSLAAYLHHRWPSER